MIDHVAIQLALRARAMTLVVCTTGLQNLGVSSTGYSRATGSFLDDGFAAGMEVAGSGFSAANNTPRTITDVTAGFITVSPPPASTQSAAAGRTLSVGLPSSRAWENIHFEPNKGVPYAEEQYIPGPGPKQVTNGPFGQLDYLPQYQLQICVPENTGILGSGRYVKALLELFPPRAAITLANGDVLRVRWDTGPYPGQRQAARPGWIVTPVTFPLWIRTTNTL